MSFQATYRNVIPCENRKELVVPWRALILVFRRLRGS